MKATLTAINRYDTRVHLTFRKNKGFVELLQKINGSLHLVWDIFFDEMKNKQIPISRFEDALYHFEDKHVTIDVFIGSKKVILILLSTEKVQQQVLDVVFEHSKWIHKAS